MSAAEHGPTTVSPQSRWKDLLAKIKMGILLTSRLDTLRDMCSENYIPPDALTKVKDCGGGAFATVELCKYKAPSGPETIVAVKRLRPSILKNKEELFSFIEECKLLRKLSHSHITRYLGVGTHMEDSSFKDEEHTRKVINATYLVQEFIDGGNLRDQVLQQMRTSHLRHKHYSQEQGLQWLVHIAKGLKYLHTARPMVIWRDAKLENVLMRKVKGGELEACLADFGLAVLIPSPCAHKQSLMLRQAMKESKSTGNAHLDGLTSQVEEILRGHELAVESPDLGHDDKSVHAGAFDLTGKTGSLFYMAPEVANSEPYNEKADVFSFGCIMYEIMCGTIVSQLVIGPTGNELAGTVYSAKVAGGYRRPLPKNLSLEMRGLITDTWAQDPHARPSMAQVLERLLQMQRSGSANGHSSTGPKAQHEAEGGGAPGGTAGAKKGCCTIS